MLRQSFQQHRFAKSLASTASLAIAVLLVLVLGGCQTDGMWDVTGALGDKTDKSSAADPHIGARIAVTREQKFPPPARLMECSRLWNGVRSR